MAAPVFLIIVGRDACKVSRRSLAFVGRDACRLPAQAGPGIAPSPASSSPEIVGRDRPKGIAPSPSSSHSPFDDSSCLPVRFLAARNPRIARDERYLTDEPRTARIVNPHLRRGSDKSRCEARLRAGTMSPESEIGSWEGKIELVDTIRGDKMPLNAVQRPAMVAGGKSDEMPVTITEKEPRCKR
jgi:hypothetical protein